MDNKQLFILAKAEAKKSVADAVKYTAQAESDTRKAQARNNIGAAGIVANAVNGNLAGLDSTGNLTDSGVSSAGETWTFTLSGGTTVTKKVLCSTLTEYAPPVLQEATAPAGFFDDYGSEWDDRKDGESGLLSEE